MDSTATRLPLKSPAPDSQVAVLRKIPHVTAVFWVMKIFATTLGETGGDLLSMKMDVGYAVASTIFIGFFLVTVSIQLAVKRYVPAVYWAVIVSTSTAGTTMSDYMNRTLGLGYAAGSAALIATLLVILGIWRAVERSLSVDRVTTRRGETFYWLAILVSNTLGTALGDYLADDSGLGFAGGAIVIGAALAVVLAVALLTKVSRVLVFWVAFVLTRPFGATMGDVLTKPREQDGLDLGTDGSSAVLAGVLLVLVIVETMRERRRRAESAPA